MGSPNSNQRLEVSRLIHLTVSFWLLVASGAAVGAEQADPRQVWQLLDYIAADYAGAVQDGTVTSPTEYDEMREFAATAAAQMADLPEHAQQPGLIAKIAVLRSKIDAVAAVPEVSRLAREIAADVLTAYPFAVSPKVLPDLARGADLYKTACSSCHGARGAGDGPVAKDLDPRPIAFTDTERAANRSPFALYQAISEGVEGTSMASFAALPEADRWALAYFVSGLSFTDVEAKGGSTLWRDVPKLREALPDLAALSLATEAELGEKIGQDRARPLLAYLRLHPDALVADARTLSVARQRLAESLSAYMNGDAAAATRLALSAYLDGFEPIEPILKAQNPALLARVEAEMGAYRNALSQGQSADALKARAAVIQGLFGDAEAAVLEARSDGVALFLGSLTILVREGLEALLIVVAMIAFLGKAERPALRVYVHAGWIGALIAGGVTWLLATHLISISGASRELTEGVSSIFAALVLLGVGLWMHHKSLAGRWQRYLTKKLTDALARRSAWFLTGVSFIAVYREIFEMILFYAALWNQGHHAAILAGLAAGTASLAAIAWGLLYASRRLPMASFFSASSLLVAVLAFVLIGKGVHSLQEAGILSMDHIGLPSIGWLAIYPTIQSLAAQVAIALIIILGFGYNYVTGRRDAA